jgi:hypothetical protein
VAQNPLDLVEKVVEQRFGTLKFVRPTQVLLRAMPVIGTFVAALEPRALGWNVVRVVEADQSRAVRRV